MSASQHCLRLPDRDLTYLEWGPARAQTIVLVHGILVHAQVWEPVASLLVQHGFRVIAPDLRGHGLSTHNPVGDGYSLLSFASDLQALVEHLRLDRFVLAGHSLGSVVAVFYAACIASGVAGVGLFETMLLGAKESVDLGALLARDLVHMRATHQHHPIATLDAAAKLLQLSYRGLSPELATKLCARGMHKTDSGLVWRWDPILRTRVGLRFPGNRAQYLQVLRRIDVPVQLLFGCDSDFTSHDEKALLSAAFIDASSGYIPGGHNLHIDSPTAVADALVKLVSRIDLALSADHCATSA